MSPGYVYLIVEANQIGEEKYKIGITKKDPEERVKKLRTGNSNNLFVIKKYQSPHYKKIEKWLHRKYSNQRTISMNEFFNLSDDQVMNFTEDCKKIDSILKFVAENNILYK
jgi:hypothetical protein